MTTPRPLYPEQAATLLPSDARTRLQAAAKTKDPRAIEKAIQYARSKYPNRFRWEPEPSPQRTLEIPGF